MKEDRTGRAKGSSEDGQVVVEDVGERRRTWSELSIQEKHARSRRFMATMEEMVSEEDKKMSRYRLQALMREFEEELFHEAHMELTGMMKMEQIECLSVKDAERWNQVSVSGWKQECHEATQWFQHEGAVPDCSQLSKNVVVARHDIESLKEELVLRCCVCREVLSCVTRQEEELRDWEHDEWLEEVSHVLRKVLSEALKEVSFVEGMVQFVMESLQAQGINVDEQMTQASRILEGATRRRRGRDDDEICVAECRRDARDLS